MLIRLNREIGTDFQIADFRHQAIYNAEQSRVEMVLISRRAQIVRLADVAIPFQTGERILTEVSYKFTETRFRHLAARAGLELVRGWTDERNWFAVHYYVRRSRMGFPA